MAFDILSFVIGQQAVKGAGGSSDKKIILAEQNFEGFAYMEEFGAYVYNFNSDAPFSLDSNETYVIQWDGTEYECVAQSNDEFIEGSILVGNLSHLGGNGNNEPFLIGYLPSTTGGAFYSFDNSTAHTVGIYQKNGNSGSGSDVTIVAKKGTFISEGITHTLEHGLGVVPLFIWVYPAAGYLTAQKTDGVILFGVGVNQKVADALGTTYDIQYGKTWNAAQAIEQQTISSYPIEASTTNAIFHDANKNTVTIGGVYGLNRRILVEGVYYDWLAVGVK